MMYSRHEEVCEIEISLRSSYAGKTEQAVAQLQRNGLEVQRADDAKAVVAGTISSDQLEDIRRLACIGELRVLSTYVAEVR
jgi:hypothetical protein